MEWHGLGDVEPFQDAKDKGLAQASRSRLYIFYFSKIYNHHYFQVKPSFVYYIHSTPHDYSRVRYELCVLYELELNFFESTLC